MRGLSQGPRFLFSLFEDFGIQDTTKRVRVNRQIRISPVRVIGADGSQLGILEVDAALRMAEDLGLDLVEVAATARPPVVRIMDYGKYKFEMAKQARQAKKKQHVIELKEVKYRPGIDDHDFDTKTRHARRFLEEKNKVKVTMMFRGRQVAHPELGQAVLDRVATALDGRRQNRKRGTTGREVDDHDSRAEMTRQRHPEPRQRRNLLYEDVLMPK